MKVTETDLPGAVIIEPDVFGDERGFFKETYHQDRYRIEAGIEESFVQDNYSRSTAGVLRGLHFQKTKPQGKLVSVSQGAVFDVAVDIDPDSATFKQWVGVHLSGENHIQFYVPPGYAHGFLVLSEIADFQYKCTELYNPDDEGGIHWDDKEIAIQWPTSEQLLVSQKDAALPTLSDYLEN
ncbi:MAG: dTDP-4-dehydrorhamnose 3,5-epimerase [Pseudomonadales bacterium]|jgi:dTDP-4-dehydrorhamnose 3,5-epimerase|tara:strand:- start:285 stop:827 length:543 start_codon:yes stop_codon:yes gene_type:complete